MTPTILEAERKGERRPLLNHFHHHTNDAGRGSQAESLSRSQAQRGDGRGISDARSGLWLLLRTKQSAASSPTRFLPSMRPPGPEKVTLDRFFHKHKS